MSKYDSLSAYTELEQTIVVDLKEALEKRGWNVIHNGTSDRHASAGLADIIVSNDHYLLTVEVTKSEGAAQDREFNSIKDHLNQVKQQNGRKQCLCLYVSPKTPIRMINSISDNNNQRMAEGKRDLKIMPLAFDSLELWLTRLRESEADLYPVSDFIRLFNSHTQFIDDLRVKKLLIQSVFPADSELVEQLEIEERENDNRILELLIKDLSKMEDYMRENGIAVSQAAIDNLIYLVFLKLYEEKRERNGYKNRLHSVEVFNDYRLDSVDSQTREAKRAIHKLFNDAKLEPEFTRTNMFTENDCLVDSIDDDFIMDYVIPVFSQYKFLGTRIDALGAVYEVLARRADKDVKVGQFFTPENVVHFMVRLAELDFKDRILDPACGTGRFLIYAMNDMAKKLNLSNVRNKDKELEAIFGERLFGTDIDPRITKIAKMNMWIHGDGKSNIFGGRDYNGLILHKKRINDNESFDNAFDVILTNPPLGELNYQVIPFVDDMEENTPEAELRTLMEKLERMPILPRKNITEERLKLIQERISEYYQQLQDIEEQISELQADSIIDEWLTLSENAKTKEERSRKRTLEQNEKVKQYKSLCKLAKSKIATIEQNKEKESELVAKIRSRQTEWEITGNKMKGGALFLASIWHYLKSQSCPDNYPEWRGGKVLIILDEGILNTDNYNHVRDFIRSHFYIKAIISLTRDTFMPISKTSTKTSIMYAIKKSDLTAIQREPIFYGHVEFVGVDTKGKVCKNDLDKMLEQYFNFKQKVLSSYIGMEFRKEKLLSQNFEGGNL